MMYKLFLPPNVLSSPPDASSGMTTVSCSIVSSAARAWEIEVPKKKYNLDYFCLLQEHVLADLTCTLLVSTVLIVRWWFSIIQRKITTNQSHAAGVWLT